MQFFASVLEAYGISYLFPSLRYAMRAMPCHSQIISVPFALIFCAWISIETIAFLAVVVDSINCSSFQRHVDVAAPLLPRDRPPNKIARALQRAAKARLYKLPLDAAVQSRRPDLIEFGSLPAPALPRDKLAEGTVRRRLQRPRAGACEREVAMPAQ